MEDARKRVAVALFTTVLGSFGAGVFITELILGRVPIPVLAVVVLPLYAFGLATQIALIWFATKAPSPSTP